MAFKFRKKHLWLLIPGLGGFLLFYIVPFLASIYYSMIDNVFNKSFTGISNYIRLFESKYFLLALKNTFCFTLTAVPILMMFSFLCALLLVKRITKINIVRLSVILPILIPTASIVLVWSILFGENSFFVTNILGITVMKDSEFFKVPVILLFIWKNAGYNIILFTAGLVQIPGELYEACGLDGAGTMQKHKHVTLPLLIPTAYFVLIISIVNSFKVFKEAYLLYGQYPKNSIYMVQHYMNNHFYKLNYQNITTAAVIFAAFVFIIIFTLYKLENRYSEGNWL